MKCQWCHFSQYRNGLLYCKQLKRAVHPEYKCRLYEREPGADDEY